MLKICKQCKTEYTTEHRPSKFCGLPCFRKAQTGEVREKRVVRRVTVAGYIEVRDPNNRKYGFILEHRLVMEQSIGRLLESKEEVHHLNHKRDDNRIENLMLCADSKEHLAQHAKERLLAYGGVENRDKWCSKCKTVKTVSEFYRSDSRGKNQCSAYCKPCCADAQRAQRLSRKEMSCKQ